MLDQSGVSNFALSKKKTKHPLSRPIMVQYFCPLCYSRILSLVLLITLRLFSSNFLFIQLFRALHSLVILKHLLSIWQTEQWSMPLTIVIVTQVELLSRMVATILKCFSFTKISTTSFSRLVQSLEQSLAYCSWCLERQLKKITKCYTNLRRIKVLF